jgi:hypothetical protein
MSIGSNHIVSKLEKNSKALAADQRLARVIAKKNKEGEYESENLNESKCVSIPRIIAVSESELKALSPHITAMLNDAQDQLIREYIINGASSINDEQISVSECIKYLDDSAKGGRITSEYMQKWFMETYAEPAAEFVVELAKFDGNSLTDAQLEVVEKKVNVIRDMFAGFASPKYSPDIPKCKAMIKFAQFLTEDNWDERMSGVIGKVQKIKSEKEAEMSLDALGFGE